MSREHLVNQVAERGKGEQFKKYFFYCLDSFIIFSCVSILRWCFLPKHQTTLDVIVSCMLGMQIIGGIIGMFIFGTWWKQSKKQE